VRLSYLWLVDITEEIGSHYAKNSLKTIKLATPMHLPTMRSSTSASAVCSRLPRKRKSKWATLTFHSSGEPLNLAYICFIASYVMSNLRHRNLLHLLLLSQMCTTNICEHNSLTTYTSLMFVRCLYRVLASQKNAKSFPSEVSWWPRKDKANSWFSRMWLLLGVSFYLWTMLLGWSADL